MNNLIHLEQRKLIQEYSFIKADLEYKNSIMSENQSAFMEKAYEKIGEERKSSEEAHSEASQAKQEKVKSDWKVFKPEIQEKAKKMYREISKRTHPDKDPEGVYSEIFAEAAKAYEDCQLFELYILSDKLNLPYEVGQDEIVVMKQEIEKSKKNLEKIENSFIYLWSTYDNPRMKEVIVDRFVKMTKGKI
jgi:hypothetical protein